MYRCKVCLREFDRPERVTSHQNFVGTGRPPKSGTRERPVNTSCRGGGIDKVVTLFHGTSTTTRRAPRTIVTSWQEPSATSHTGGRSQSSGEAPVQGSGEDLSLASSQSALVVSCWRDDPEEGSEEALDQGLCASDDDVSKVRPGDSDDQDEGPSVDDWEHAVDQMFVLVCKQQACADRSPCLAFDPFQDSPGERRARGLPSSQAKLVAPEPCARTRTTLNPSESLLHEYIARHGLSTMQINGLLAMVQNPLFVRELVSFQSAVGYRSRVDRTVASVLQQVSLHSESESTMDGTNNLNMWYRPVEDIITQMVQSPKYAGRMHWTFRRTVDQQSGHRVFTCLADSLWFESVSCQIQSTFGENTHVVPVVVGSDATQTRKRAGAHPVYISIGSLDSDMRRSTAAWVLAGFIPPLLPEKLGLDIDGKVFPSWRVNRRRRQIHNTAVYHILKGLVAHFAAGGVTVRCADGVTRRLMYVFAQYITDRQEHETILFAQAHSCFHCDCPQELRGQWSACTWPTAQPKHGHVMCQAAQLARDTGSYYVSDVNMDVTDANMHVTAVTCMLYCFCIEGHLQVVFARQASMELMRSGRNCTLVSGRARQGLF